MEANIRSVNKININKKESTARRQGWAKLSFLLLTIYLFELYL